MKKILLLLLIFTLCLVGCQPAETPPENNETPNGDQTVNPPSDPSHDTQTPSDATDNTTPPEKTPATQITNEGEPQDENDDFLFVFKGKSGYFARGEMMGFEFEIINNTGKTHGYISGEFSANPWLHCVNNGETYTLVKEPYEMTGDASYLEVEPGGSVKNTFYYNIPTDAPAGEYTLTCSYNGFRKDFEGYFTLK